MIRAYVGLGANLDGPAARLRRVLDELDAVPSTRVAARSPLYRSAPLGPPDQPDYINAVAALDTGLDPVPLLHALRSLEARHGRRRDGERWGPRTLDLDLLLYGELTMRTSELTLPHPGLHERAFVLYPLSDVAPALAVPGHGTIDALLKRLPDSGIERLENEPYE